MKQAGVFFELFEDGWAKGLAVVLCSLGFHAGAYWVWANEEPQQLQVSSGAFSAPVNLSFTQLAQAAPEPVPPPEPVKEEIPEPEPEPEPIPEPEPEPLPEPEIVETSELKVAEKEPEPEPEPTPEPKPEPVPEPAPVVASAAEPVVEPGLDEVVIVTEPQFRSPPTPPDYPRKAQRRNQQGIVMVEALVDENGEILEITVIESSGYPLLDRAALKAVARWEFQPRVVGSRAMRSKVQVPVAFELQG